jgi:hypothetical protein
MASVRFTTLQSRPREFLDFTSLTLDEFQQLVRPFEAAFHTRMAAWRMDGPCTCPLRINPTNSSGRLSQEQKGLDERALATS